VNADQPPSPAAPARRRRLGWHWRILRVAVLAYLGLSTVLFFKQTDLVFPRQMAGVGNAALSKRPDCERLWITADDGVRVEGWFFKSGPKTSKDPGPARPCVVMFHGNADLIDNMVDYADFLLSHDVHVLLVEFRGYARSGGISRADGEREGKPSERAVVADSLKFIDALGARKDVDSSRLVYYGRSLGTGIAAQLAARRRPAAVILESPFTSVTSFAARYGIPPFLVKHPFRTDRVLPPLASAGLPVLILSSRDDEIVPFSHGQRLSGLMPSAKFVAFSGSHNALPLNQPVFEEGVVEFLNTRLR
jgi:pimeloyl-ACP methyl ester carboxylesterase